MEWKDWGLLGYIGILLLGLALALHPFYIHTHHHQGHIALRADQVDCPTNGSEQNLVNYSDLSPPIQDVIDKAVENEGEGVVIHAAEIIDGDEGSDWRTDSPREAQASENLQEMIYSESTVRYGRKECYQLSPSGYSGGIPIGQGIIVLSGLFLIANGVYYGWKNIQER